MKEAGCRVPARPLLPATYDAMESQNQEVGSRSNFDFLW